MGCSRNLRPGAAALHAGSRTGRNRRLRSGAPVAIMRLSRQPAMLIRFLTWRGSCAVLTLLCATAVAPRGRAQEPRRLATSDSIPVDLASALIASGGIGGDPQILVGALPGWINNRIYVPANARILGSAFIGQTVVGVMSVPDAPEAAIEEFKRELPSRGWRSPPPQPSYGGGFRASTPFSPGGSPTYFLLCGDQQTLSTSASRHRGTNTLVVVRVSTQVGQYGVCAPPPVPIGMMRSPFPTLFNPAGAVDARMTADCGAGFGGSSGTGTNLHLAMSSEAILDHYAKQLVDSGWRAASAAAIVGRTFTRTDSTGAPLELSLTIASSSRDSTCRDVNMQVRTLRKP